MKNLPAAQHLIFDGSKLLLVLIDASVIEVDLESNAIKEVLSASVYRQVTKTKMRLYDKVVLKANYNPNNHYLTLIFANPTFNGIYNLLSSALYWQLPQVVKGLALSLCSDMDKLLVVYDTNQIVVFDTINRKLNEWSIENMNKLPANYLRRYNRVIGVVQLSSTKFILWTNYTYAVLDLKLDLPAESQILADHPNNSLQAKHLEADGWFDTLKLT